MAEECGRERKVFRKLEKGVLRGNENLMEEIDGLLKGPAIKLVLEERLGALDGGQTVDCAKSLKKDNEFLQ
jgi:hypothetical protein